MRLLIIAFFLFSITLFPKSVVLTDSQKQELRNWMEALALEAVANVSLHRLDKLRRWGRVNRDCAGFIRYLLWESLQTHDDRWRQHFAGKLTRKLKNVEGASKLRRYVYPRLKKNARNFIEGETIKIGRKIQKDRLKTGDLLYFVLEDEKGKETSHLMLLIRKQDDGKFWVIYHTGQPRNQLKALSLEDLMKFPDTRWQPEFMNPYFQGVFRLKLLQ